MRGGGDEAEILTGHIKSVDHREIAITLVTGVIPNPLWRAVFSFLVVETFHRNVSTTTKEKTALQSGFGITPGNKSYRYFTVIQRI